MNKGNDPLSQSQIPQQKKRKCHMVNEANISEKKLQKLENAHWPQGLFQQRKRKDNPVDPAKTYVSKRITNGQKGFKQNL